MILAQKGDPGRDEDDDEWYMGKFVGLPKPDSKGEWYIGKRLGVKKKGNDLLEEGKVVVVEPLTWKNVSQLCSDLVMTQHIEGIVAALEISCTIVDDNITLAVSALNALIRMGTGRLDRAVKFGECGACEHVTTLLHWYGYTEVDKLSHKVPLEHRASYQKLVQDCITVALGAIEVLAAGCKPNREKLGYVGACSYVVEILRRHGDAPDCVYLKELAFNCIWQLSFGNSYNRHRLREAGAENELWKIAHRPGTTPAQSSRSMAVLGWLKSQLANDIMISSEPRHVVGGLLLSISEITNTRAKGSPTEALKLAHEGFRAIARICTTRESATVMETFIDGVSAPEVTRRIIRHHKRLFRDDVEQLCMFIADSCEAINCMLSESYRREKAGVQNELAAKTALEEDEEEGDSKKNVLALEEKSLERRESGASPSAGGAVGESMHSRERAHSTESFEIVEKVSDEDVTSLGSSGQLSASLRREKWLVQRSVDMMCDAGVVRMLVKELELYIDPQSSHFEKPSSHTHISLQPTNIFAIDPMSLLSSGTGVITKGVIAGFQGVKMGFTKINETIQASITKNVSFPDTPEGNCISVISSSIRLLCDISLPIRASFLDEELPDSCRKLMTGSFEYGVSALRAWFLDKISTDLRQPCVVHTSSWDGMQEEDEIITFSMALKVLYQFGGNPKKPYVPMDEVSKNVFIEALNHIGKYVSVHGAGGEHVLEIMNGYERLFMPMNKALLPEFQVMDAWLQAITNTGLARLEAKTKLGSMGACEIILDTLRVHSLRAQIVQRCLWTLCVLAANHEENIHRISVWNSQTWNADTAHSLLLNVQRSKGQTNEARDHAGLILSWMELRKNMGMSRKSRLHRQAQAEAHESSGNDDKNDVVVPLPLKLGKANSTAVPDFAPDEHFFNFEIRGRLQEFTFTDDFAESRGVMTEV